MSKPLKTPIPTTYIWKGKNQRGEKVEGEMNGRNIAFVKIELRRQGITPEKLKKKSQHQFFKKTNKITSIELMVFTRQMSTMLKSGIPLIQSFDILSKGQENPACKDLINQLKSEVETGAGFSDALKKFPRHFNELFCNLIQAGEKSGSLDIMLENLATYKEKTENLKRKIKKALYYPTAILIVAFVISTILLLFVVPQFESLFKGFGADLPIMTQMVLNLSAFMQSYWYILFAILGLTIFGLKTLHSRSKEFAFWLDTFILRLPIFGPILRKAAIARFSRTLAITFAAGLPLVDALKSVAGATGNLLYSKATLEILNNVSTGQQLQLAMQNTKVFPNMAVQMIAIGEESGSLELMLGKVADFYEAEVDAAVDSLSTLLEPVIMVVLGGIVGGLVISMYLPIFKMGQVV